MIRVREIGVCVVCVSETWIIEYYPDTREKLQKGQLFIREHRDTLQDHYHIYKGVRLRYFSCLTGANKADKRVIK